MIQILETVQNVLQTTSYLSTAAFSQLLALILSVKIMLIHIVLLVWMVVIYLAINAEKFLQNAPISIIED